MKTLALLAMLLLQGNPAANGKGAVTGRLLNADGMPAAGIRVALREAVEPGSVPAIVAIAETDEDGRYRLENIPPGRYYVVAGLVDIPTYFPGTLTPTTATVVQVLAGKTLDQRSFSLVAPLVRQRTEVRGRVINEDGSPFQNPTALPFNIAFSGAGAAFPDPDGLIHLYLLEGEYSVSVFELPLGFVVKAISSGTSDILKSPLRVIASAGVSELIVTVTKVPLESISGVRVSGRVVPFPPSRTAGARVHLSRSEPGTPGIETTVNPDGGFEFVKVPPGKYFARAVFDNANDRGHSQQLFVETDNISGLDLRADIYTTVSGHFTVVDTNGIPVTDVLPSATVIFRSVTHPGTGTPIARTGKNGKIQIALEDAEWAILIYQLPPEFTILSIMAGTTDLMKASLKVDWKSPPPEIEVRVEYRKP